MWLSRVLLPCLLLSSCGYTLKGASPNYLRERGVETIFIEPFFNRTYKPGAETLVYNALVRTIAANKRMRITYDKYNADAVLTGSVSKAEFSRFKTTVVTNINVTGNEERVPDGHPEVSSVYSAHLTCDFRLVRGRSKHQGKRGEVLWSSGVSRSKRFNASNEFSVLGTTSSIINDSEFERALKDLADSMMGDVHEFMLAMF